MKSATGLVWIYVTCADQAEASRIGRALVKERLAACANIVGSVRSIYRWKGKIKEGREVALVLKARQATLTKLTTRVRELHSYDVPCVVALPIVGGNRDFLDWVKKETKTR